MNVKEAKELIENNGVSEEYALGFLECWEKTSPFIDMLKEMVDEGSCWNPKDLGGCGGNYVGEPCPHHKAKILLSTIKEIEGEE